MNLKVLSQNLQFDPPPPTISHKRILLVYPVAKFDKTYWHSGLTNIIDVGQSRIL